MHNLPFRTNKTWLTDDQLILLDVLFDRGAVIDCLRQDGFREQWNLSYSHSYNDDQLRCHLRWLCEHGVLSQEDEQSAYRMTTAGGALWSEERCPVWDRYCIERYRTTSQRKMQISVLAVNPNVRDHFLALWVQDPVRLRTAVVTNHPLIDWHPFNKVYVGMVICDEQPHQWTVPEYLAWLERDRQQRARIERERSWWRCVRELQKFIPQPT